MHKNRSLSIVFFSSLLNLHSLRMWSLKLIFTTSVYVAMEHVRFVLCRRIVAALEIVCLGHRVIEVINLATISKYCNFCRLSLLPKLNTTHFATFHHCRVYFLSVSFGVSLELWIANARSFCDAIVLRNWLRNYTRCVFSCRCSVIECGFFFSSFMSHRTLALSVCVCLYHSLDSLELIYLFSRVFSIGRSSSMPTYDISTCVTFIHTRHNGV